VALPGYDTIGAWAPVLLVLARLAQGSVLPDLENGRSNLNSVWGQAVRT
jgi:hypothetical protein